MIEDPNNLYRTLTKDNKEYLRVAFKTPLKPGATEKDIAVETKYLQYIIDLTLLELSKTPGMRECADPRLEYIVAGSQLVKACTPWIFGFSYLIYRRFRVTKQNTRLKAFFKAGTLFSIAFFGLVMVTNITNFDAKNNYIENRLCKDNPDIIKEVKERLNH